MLFRCGVEKIDKDTEIDAQDIEPIEPASHYCSMKTVQDTGSLSIY